MSPATIDLDHQLDCLRGLRADLEEHFWSGLCVGPGVQRLRYALSVAIGQLAQRIACLEEITRHHDTPSLRADGLSDDEARALERSLGVLDGEFVIEDDLAAASMWTRVRRILSAVDDLLLAAARALPEGAAVESRPSRTAIVIPLARSVK